MVDYLAITITYASQYTVHGPTVDQPIVHAMREDDSHTTMCGKRPINYCAVPNRAVTCQKCWEEIRAWQPEPEQPKAKPAVRRQPRPKEEIDPAIEREMRGAEGRSRAIWLTPRGQALVDKWAAEESQS